MKKIHTLALLTLALGTFAPLAAATSEGIVRPAPVVVPPQCTPEALSAARKVLAERYASLYPTGGHKGPEGLAVWRQYQAVGAECPKPQPQQ